jgi:hypothetical protein
MDIQKIITYLIVATAALWLGRQWLHAWRAFRQNKGGCGSGCGKCEFAGKEKTVAGPAASTRGNVIPLTAIRPSKRTEPK